MKLYLIKCAYVLSGVLMFLIITKIYIISNDLNNINVYLLSAFAFVCLIIFIRCERIIIDKDKSK